MINGARPVEGRNRDKEANSEEKGVTEGAPISTGGGGNDQKTSATRVTKRLSFKIHTASEGGDTGRLRTRKFGN